MKTVKTVKTFVAHQAPPPLTPRDVDDLIAGRAQMLDVWGRVLPHRLKTPQHRERLEHAKRVGYLVCTRLMDARREAMALANAYFVWCASRGLPCVRVYVDTWRRRSSIGVEWVAVPDDQRPSGAACHAAARVVATYASAKGFQWSRSDDGAYSANPCFWRIRRVPIEDAEALAAQWAAICHTAVNDASPTADDDV